MKKFKLILLLFLFSIYFLPSLVMAVGPGNPNPGNPPAGTVSLTNPLTGKDTYAESTDGIPTLLGKIINAVLGVVGSLALVMFIYGGITWMLSAGNQEQVTKGKNILIWATIGIVIIFTAYALVRFVLTTVTA